MSNPNGPYVNELRDSKRSLGGSLRPRPNNSDPEKGLPNQENFYESNLAPLTSKIQEEKKLLKEDKTDKFKNTSIYSSGETFLKFLAKWWIYLMLVVQVGLVGLMGYFLVEFFRLFYEL